MSETEDSNFVYCDYCEWVGTEYDLIHTYEDDGRSEPMPVTLCPNCELDRISSHPKIRTQPE